MIKHYISNRYNSGNEKEARIINTETGEFLHYFINDGAKNCGINFPFGFFATTTADMGYNSPSECEKELKRRGYLKQEVRHDRQRADEISALLALAKFRHDNGRKLANIPEILTTYYGLSEEYTKKILRNITQYNIERHVVEVYAGDELLLSTEINTTPEEIEHFYIGLYIDGKTANRVEFIA